MDVVTIQDDKLSGIIDKGTERATMTATTQFLHTVATAIVTGSARRIRRL